MANLYSIGELIDKLVIENIKIFRLREQLHTSILNEKEYTEINNKMMHLVENRSIITSFLNEKINDVSKGLPNLYLKDIRTYKRNENI